MIIWYRRGGAGISSKAPLDRRRNARAMSAFPPMVISPRIHYGVMRLSKRGKGMVSLMWRTPLIQPTRRSSP